MKPFHKSKTVAGMFCMVLIYLMGRSLILDDKISEILTFGMMIGFALGMLYIQIKIKETKQVLEKK